ncbi:protein AF-10 isoform X2 [Coregonus clupeaformis]|uniref:protein AF-10 isoform X2 n=1 Tax=Coregonus clupeaformis TaxID=59861 RepID=UPI001E1C33C4|nr:protein AF-10 isoform X2 [Coregonus clupeaformis]
MVSGELCLAADNDFLANNMKEMIGGCCVCSDERGWAENPLVYCDGHGCNVAVHQACYGIVQVPTGPWFCRKCESQERAARVRCELCPHKDGALKRTDNGGWAHVVCALYIPEVEFANVSTMEPIVLQSVPHDRYNKKCYICEDQGRESKAATGACMTCNKHGCRQAFHVTCAQFAGLLCEEQGSDADNVKYCGYCKYHYSKLRRSRARGSRAQSLSDSSSQCSDKPPDHQDNKKHKERERHKPKYKKTLELSPSLAPTLMVASDKSYNSSSSSSGGGGVSSMPASSQKRLDDSAARFTTANFQEVPVHSGGAKDCPPTGSEGKPGSEVKQGKKSISQGIGVQRGRKSLTPGKPLPSAVVTTATSSTAASSTGTFHQALLLSNKTSSTLIPPTSDFLGFSDPSLRSGGGDSFSSPSFSRCLVKPSEVTASECMASLSTFGSMMSLPGCVAGGKLYENSHSEPTGNIASTAGYKRPSSSSSSSAASSSGPGIGGGGEGGGEEGVKEKKKRGNWRNRYGPCFSVPDGKATDGPEHHTAPLPLPSSSLCATSSSSPSPSSTSALPGRPGGGGGERVGERGLLGVGISGGIQKSPSLLRNGSLPCHGVTSTPSGTGAFSSGDVSSGAGPASMSGANSELPQQQPTPSLAPPTPFTATAPMTNTASPHVSGLPGPVFNMAPSHMFGNRLNPNSAMAALIAQSQASPADQEVGDGNSIGAPGFSRRVSPKTTLCPRSPLGGLQIRYDPAGSLGSGLGLGGLGSGQGGGGDTAPPVATSIEQLLERQWSDGQQFLLQQGAQGDVLGMLKSLHQLQQENRRLEDQIKTLTMKKERLQLLSAQLSVPFTPTAAAQDVKSDSSLPIPAQDSVSCGRSSGGSTSSLSTPPSVSHSPPQPPQLNGVAMGTMMLGGGAGLGMGGVVGVLNGVIQTTSSPHTYTHTHTSAPGTSATLPISSSINNRLGALSEQQRLLLHQHQLQQLLSSQPSAEQQQVLLYQLMQQQQDLHQLQSLSSSSQLPSIALSSAQLPITSLPSSSHGQGTITANPFLALHTHTHSHPDTHTHATAQKPRLAEKAVGVTGQEKT